MYTITTNRVRDKVAFVEGAERLVLTVDVDPFGVIGELQPIIEDLKKLNDSTPDGEILRLATELGTRIFGAEQMAKLSEFYGNNEKQLFIKRVIGLPGETAVVRDGDVYIIPKTTDVSGIDDSVLYADRLSVNGAFLTDNSFCPEEPEGFGDGVYRVPEDHYFMLGDNRNHSKDSRDRQYGQMGENRILGRVIIRITPDFGFVE